MAYWEVCVIDPDYEIYSDYPHPIRRISNKQIVSEWNNGNGYIRLILNGKKYYKHRVIACQWIDNPNNYKYVDHINRKRKDNRIENLRFVSASENNLNRTSTNSIEYKFIDYQDEPEDLLRITDYGEYQFENYYYSPNENSFYFDNGVQLRQLHTNYAKGNKCAFVYALATNNKRIKICINKFKRLYDLV